MEDHCGPMQDFLLELATFEPLEVMVMVMVAVGLEDGLQLITSKVVSTVTEHGVLVDLVGQKMEDLESCILMENHLQLGTLELITRAAIHRYDNLYSFYSPRVDPVL